MLYGEVLASGSGSASCGGGGGGWVVVLDDSCWIASRVFWWMFLGPHFFRIRLLVHGRLCLMQRAQGVCKSQRTLRTLHESQGREYLDRDVGFFDSEDVEGWVISEVLLFIW